MYDLVFIVTHVFGASGLFNETEEGLLDVCFPDLPSCVRLAYLKTA